MCKQREGTGCPTWVQGFPLTILAMVMFASLAHAANWKKHRGEFTGEWADCIDISSIKTDAKRLTHFRWYVIDDDKFCGRPTRDDYIEEIAVSCPDVMAAGEPRDAFPINYLYFDRIRNRGWVESSGPRRQFARLLQYVCRNRK